MQDSSYIVQISQPGIVPIVRVPPRAQHELDTGCLEACRPKSLQSSMSTPFLRDKTLKFAHAFIEPLPSLLRKRFFFFPTRYLGFCFFLGFLGLEGSHISGANLPPPSIRKGLGRGTLSTRVQDQGLSLQIGVDISTFER